MRLIISSRFPLSAAAAAAAATAAAGAAAVLEAYSLQAPYISTSCHGSHIKFFVHPASTRSSRIDTYVRT